MLLEFKVMKLKEDSMTKKKIFSRFDNFRNEFIIVGEEGDNYKVCELVKDGLKLFGELKIDLISLTIAKDELICDSDGVGVNYVSLDIPKKNLTLDTVENIKRLNE